MTEAQPCAHHWVLGALVSGPPDPTPSKGLLRYRESTCRLCGDAKVLPERELNYISLLETVDEL